MVFIDQKGKLLHHFVWVLGQKARAIYLENGFKCSISVSNPYYSAFWNCCSSYKCLFNSNLCVCD